MNFTKSKIFLTLCLGFILGIFLGQYLGWTVMAISAMIFIALGSIGFSNKTILVLSLTGILALVGATRFKLDYAQNDLSQFYTQKISGTGQISEEPDVRPDKVFLTVSHVVINGQALKSKILFNVSRFPEYAYGQQISFTGKLTAPKDAQNPGDFSYKNYLSRYGIDGLIYYPKITVTGHDGNFLKTAILNFKHKWTANLNSLIPEPQNAFLGGLLLGAKRQIPQKLIDAFNATGTSHMIAVSGYNITIIAAGIDWVLRKFLRKRLAFWATLVGIGVFVIMTGATASVVRAGIMGALVLVALNIGRMYKITNALVFTAVVMLVINPQILAFDVGFQLSFAALLGLVYISPILEKYFLWVPGILRPYLLATLAAQAAALPILMFNFGTLSLIAPIANVLVMPLVPITMLFGFLAGLASLIWLKLALPFTGIAWLLLTVMIKIIEFLASIPYASLAVVFSWPALTIYYLILGLIVSGFYTRFNIIKPWRLWTAKPSDSLST